MTLTDADYASLTLWAEGRGELVEGRIGIASVLRNRLASKRWGHSLSSVCLAPMQFSCWQSKGGDRNYQALLALEAAVEAGTPILDQVYAECRWIIDGLLSGALRDRVAGATHYFVTAMPKPPVWARGLTPACQIGAHSFYAGVK